MIVILTGGGNMEEWRTADTEAANMKAKALLLDLFDYFRMDSNMDAAILFEHLCCVLLQLREGFITVTSGENKLDPVQVYMQMMGHFSNTQLGRQVQPDPSVFLNRPELLRRLLDTAAEVSKLSPSESQLAILLLDLLETVSRSRQGEIINTPYATAKEIVRLIYPQEENLFFLEILDPAFGSGAFLFATLERIKEEHQLFPPRIQGFERDEHLRRCVLLLSYLYTDLDYSLELTDGGSPIEITKGRFNLILANPPFRTQSLRDREFLGDTNSLPVSTKDTHHAFIQRTLQGLAPDGICAIIVPDSFLSHTSSDAIRMRRWIVEKFQCMGVVKLPHYTFYPQAAVNASVLFIRNPMSYQPASAKEARVFFFAVELDGRSNDTRRLPVSQNDFDELRSIWKEQNLEGFWREWCEEAHTQNVHGMDVPVRWDHPHFWFGSLGDICSNDYSLLPEQYQPIQLTGEPVQDPEEILGELQKLGQELMELTNQLSEEMYG